MSLQVRILGDKSCREQWNAFVSASPVGHVMQSWEWGAFKTALGWEAERVALERDGQIVAGAQVLVRRLPFLPLSIAYIPKGPVADLTDRETVTALFDAIHSLARRRHALVLKIEPNAPDDERVHTMLRECSFQATPQTNQPRSTIVVDLSGGEAALWSNLRRTAKKLVRKARRAGVEVVEGGADDLDAFYAVLSVTARIKGFPIHDANFYRQAWRAFRPSGNVHLLLARYDGQVVAAKMILTFAGQSMHLWGGTSEQGRAVNASYLIQWEAIRWALQQGCRSCDLWGIPDQVGALLKAGQEVPPDRHGGLWGVYTFKRGFGGQVRYYVGAYDFPYRRGLYRLGRVLLAQQETLDSASRWLERLSRGGGRGG